MDTGAGFPRQRGSAARCISAAASASRQTGCEDGSPSDPQMRALAQPRLILGMQGRAAAMLERISRTASVVFDQKIAGGGAHEHS
jgi:hypothetical protein